MTVKPGTTVEVSAIKLCDICKYVDRNDKPNVAMYDMQTTTGQWANICVNHVMEHGAHLPNKLGVGKGQKLIYPEGLVQHYLETGEVTR